MEFVSVRDMRLRPGEVWAQLKNKRELVLTCNGRPKAIMISVENEDIEKVLKAVRLARMQLALSAIRAAAAASGASQMTPEEIDAEIRAVRAQRKREALTA